MAFSAEEFPDAVVSYLRLALPTAIGALEAKYAAADVAAARDVPLPIPREQDYFPGGRGAHGSRFPYVEVALSDLAIENYSLTGFADVGGNAPEGDGVAALIVLVYAQHANFDALYRQTYRYGSAVYACVMATGALPGSARVQRFRGAWRFNPDPEPGQEQRDALISGVMLKFDVETAGLVP